ncbi:hypothetical protein NP493_2270g00001 [Ridgeia piscesae]|uniref:Uncharacterized protein n=1 Tax=Ridgeia piscesae TaxID=27915 RepID=A0AAD9JID6_RIDPI|nr:hypothetical protein NP493_2270g00001 [Ridgeia piscesae]
MTRHPQTVKPPVSYSVSVSVICGAKQQLKCFDGKENADRCQDGVFLNLIEHQSSKHNSTGGSSFRIISMTSLARKMCSYIDMFDGTYVAWCPFSLGSECANISVSLDFYNFTAFTGIHKPLRNVVWDRMVCRGQQLSCSIMRGSTEKNKMMLHPRDVSGLQYETARRNAITWQRHIDGWQARLSWQNGKLFHINKTTLCKRLKRFGRMIMVGASHMRYKADHIVIQCYKMPVNIGRKHSSMAVNNVEFLRRRWTKEFRSLPAELLKRNLTKGDLVLIQTGAHDMGYDGLEKTMAVAVPHLLRVLRKVSVISRTRGFHVVYVTSPAYPRLCNESSSVRGSRNNFALAAYHGRIKSAMNFTGIGVFDEFSAFLTYEEEAICGAHYLCRTLDDLSNVSGEIGKTAAELLLAYATN